MFQEKRPTCVTVIGWAWVIIGGLMCLSAITALFMSLAFNQMVKSQPIVPPEAPAGFGIFALMAEYFPLIATVQLFVAVFGIIAGINFLKLKSWARNALETLTWLLLLFVIGFMVFWLFTLFAMTSASNAPIVMAVFMAVMGVVVTGVYGVPLGIMLKYLRGEKVRAAMLGNDKPQIPPAQAVQKMQ